MKNQGYEAPKAIVVDFYREYVTATADSLTTSGNSGVVSDQDGYFS